MEYISAPGSKMTNGECMDAYAQMYFNQFLMYKKAHDSPHERMEKEYGGKCVRHIIDFDSIN
jgi:hypothetical protein